MATREQVYEKFGITAEAAQLFETELGTILLALEGEKQGWHIAADAKRATVFYEKLNRKTLGELLRSVREYVDFAPDVDAAFEIALAARNRLNHGFFERHNLAIFSEAGCVAMIADLDRLHDQLLAAYNIAQPVSTQLVLRLKALRTRHDQSERDKH
jgi:hypothetical protein